MMIEKRITHVGAMAVLGLILVQPAMAADFSPQAIADRLSSQNLEAASDFSPANGIACVPGARDDRFAIRCHEDLFDSERSAQVAAVDFLIYDSDPDFAAEDATLAGSVRGMGGQWQISVQPRVTITGPAGPFNPAANCRQSLGTSNGPALCLMQATTNVLVLARVAPAIPVTEAVEMEAGSRTYQDTDRATTLATMAVTHALASR
jgi:hypothetical protein